MGLDVYLQRGEEHIAIDSAHFPDHMFKIGYFRSSYNDGGTNAILRQSFGTTLEDLFGLVDGEYEMTPHWGAARANALALVERMEARIAEGSPILLATREWNMGLQSCADREEALRITREQVAKATPDFNALACAQGRFWGEPIKLRGIVHDADGVYYIVRQEPAEWLRWYLNAVKIVVETCDWALAQPDCDKLSMSWSG